MVLVVPEPRSWQTQAELSQDGGKTEIDNELQMPQTNGLCENKMC